MHDSLAILTVACLVALAPSHTRGQTPGPAPTPTPAVDLDYKPPVPAATTAGPRQAAPAPNQHATDRAAPAKALAPRPVASPIAPGTVLFARAADGGIWASGDNFKANFDRQGMTFVPFFGSNAPRSWPLQLSLASVTAAAPLTLAEAAPELRARQVTIARGACTEVYDVDATGIEQSFVFAVAPQGDDLVLRLRVATDLEVVRADAELRFAGPHGYVGYTDAIAFDATGARFPVQTSFAAGHVELRVAAPLLAQARGAFTIDPRISTFLVHAPTPPYDIWLRPDIAHGDLQRGSAFVYERAYSTTDHDVYSQLCDSSGAALPGTGVWININTDYWAKPRVGYQAAAQSFLVVAERGPSGNALPHDIRGCIRGDLGAWVGSEFTISGTESGSKVDPVVGGDSNPTGPSTWCVVWQRNYAADDSDIHFALVQADGTSLGGVRMIDNSAATLHYQPSISRSNGSHDELMQRWNIVFLHQLAPGDIDVWFARLNRDGSTFVASRFLDTNQAADYNAVASTATEGDLWLACYERLQSNGDTDIVAKIMGGPGFGSGAINLSALENYAPTRRQRRPRVDSDGLRFAVVYEELYPLGVNDWDILAATFMPAPASAGFQLLVHESHAVLANTGDLEYDPQIASAWGANWWEGPYRTPRGRPRYLTTWTHQNGIEGAVYEGRAGVGSWTSLATGCGPQLAGSGNPVLGAPITLSMAGASPARAIYVGAPLATPVAVCAGCSLGFELGASVVFPIDPLTLVIPGEAGLLQATVAFQGIELASGGCPAGFRLTNTLRVTID